ncbi:hypothetical protein D6783_03365, partial [Candidatus Woesearchaeota archaeon]
KNYNKKIIEFFKQELKFLVCKHRKCSGRTSKNALKRTRTPGKDMALAKTETPRESSLPPHEKRKSETNPSQRNATRKAQEQDAATTLETVIERLGALLTPTSEANDGWSGSTQLTTYAKNVTLQPETRTYRGTTYRQLCPFVFDTSCDKQLPTIVLRDQWILMNLLPGILRHVEEKKGAIIDIENIYVPEENPFGGVIYTLKTKKKEVQHLSPVAFYILSRVNT